MKKVLLSIFICLVASSNISFCQTNLLLQNRNIIYKAFVKEVVFYKLKVKTVLTGKPNKINDSSIIFKDSLFTKDDIVWIRKQISLIEKFSWSEIPIKNVKVIENSKESENFQDKHINKYPCHYTISIPLFTIDMQKCIFYYGYSCGGLSGEGVLAIYKKVNGNWIVLKEYDHWFG